MRFKNKSLSDVLYDRNKDLLALCANHRVLTFSQGHYVLGLEVENILPGSKVVGIGTNMECVEVSFFIDISDIPPDPFGPSEEDVFKKFEEYARATTDFEVKGSTIKWRFESLLAEDILENARVFVLEVEHLYRRAVNAANEVVFGNEDIAQEAS